MQAKKDLATVLSATLRYYIRPDTANVTGFGSTNTAWDLYMNKV